MQYCPNIVLIGMPGVGKSTVGVLLAKRLGMDFVDTDIRIQSHEGDTLQGLIKRLGSEGFCDLEARHIQSLALRDHVIATGGSVVYRHAAMRCLGADGLLLHLDIGLESLRRRLDDIEARGVVVTAGQTLTDLYLERRPLYSHYADVEISTDGLSPDRVILRILKSLEQRPWRTAADGKA
jgi:shikimate kinase